MPYVQLFIAIFFEVIATTALKASYGMTKLYPALVVLVGYPLCFWTLSLSLRTLPVGIVYAVWSGVGIVAIAAIGVTFFNEHLSLLHYVGMGLILLGIFILMLIA